jgi:hypothetical protein
VPFSQQEAKMKTLQAVGVGFGLAVGFAGACVAFVMCGAAAVARSTATEVEPAAPAAERLAEPSAAEPAPDPAFEVNIATFSDDQLAECLDFQIMPKPGEEAAAQKQIDKLEAISTSKKPLLLSKPCAEQFAGRTVLAMCSFINDTDFGRVSVSSHHYSPHNVVGNDSAMRDCISSGGNWQANPDEWAVRKVQRRKLLQQAQEIVGELK